MVPRGLRTPGLLLLLWTSAPADVTLRQTSTVTLASFIPPEFQAQIGEQLQGRMSSETLLQIRGDKAYATYGSMGGESPIMDVTS